MQNYYSPPVFPHSGFGIASVATSLIADAVFFFLVVVSVIMEADSPNGLDQDSPMAIVIGLMLLLALAAQCVALGLGIAGLAQNERAKLFSVLGTVFSVTSLIGCSMLLIIGAFL
ncbi:hypothetical protein AwPolaro_02060 [Polaromonas sp.]|nr:hypothetical protein AwPolaro_02060 [Polaromonas sp.]